MDRIQFFYDDDLIALELKINEWLSSNKEKKIISSNLQAFGTPSARAGITSGEKYVFYILYSMAEWETLLLEKTVEEEQEVTIPSLNNIETNANNKAKN